MDSVAPMDGSRTEQEKSVPPVYELLISKDDSPSASLRVASVPRGEQQVVVRCAIAPDSVGSFVPGTLALHRNGKRVRGVEEQQLGWRRGDRVQNSINYAFVPWPERLFKQKRSHPRPVLFHCSASARPIEVQRRGRIPLANFYQRTLKMTPAKRAHAGAKLVPCPPAAGEKLCRDVGTCVQVEDEPSTRFCLCTDNFGGQTCERLGNGGGPLGWLVGAVPATVVSLVSVAAMLALIVVVLAALLFARERGKRLRTPRTSVRLESDGTNEGAEEDDEETPLEGLYDLPDNGPAPPLGPAAAPARANIYTYPEPKPPKPTPQRRAQSEYYGGRGGGDEAGYDNLEQLRAEIRRQSEELEQKRAGKKAKGGGESTETEESRDSCSDLDTPPSCLAPSPPQKAYASERGLVQKS